MPLRAGASPKQRVIEINQRMNALGRERRLTEALGLLPELRAQGLKPTAVTFNVLLSAFEDESEGEGEGEAAESGGFDDGSDDEGGGGGWQWESDGEGEAVGPGA